MGKVKWLLLLLSFCIYNVFADERSFNEKIHYGIRETEDRPINYSPFFHQDLYSKHLIYDEDIALNKATFSSISSTLFELNGFLHNEFYPAFFCTHEELANFENYFRYAYRALAMSFLYEQTREMQESMSLFGKDMSCRPDWHKVFGDCLAKSSEMQAFVKNIHGILNQEKYDFEVILDKKNERRQKWIDDYKNGQFISAHKRVQKYIGANTQNMSVENITTALAQSCQENINAIGLICREQDEIYGISSQALALKLLITSDIFATLAGKSNVVGCLQRFAIVNKHQEKPIAFLNASFPLIYNAITLQKQRYPQGRLFPAATLKFFEDKGLAQILKHEKVPETKLAVVPDIKEEKKVETTVAIVKKEITSASTPVEAVIAKKEIVISAFKEASDLQKKLQLEKVEVDLLKFKYDFPYTSDQLKRLGQITPPFVSHKGLTDMKNRDHLGEKNAPMPLNLLKYLIEEENHQALYNIISVVGDKFFVMNNVDQVNKNEISYVALVNDENGHRPWQLFILNESFHTTSR